VVVASTGQTVSHGAFWQCWHIMGWWTLTGSSSGPPVITVYPYPVHDADALNLVSLPTTAHCFPPGTPHACRAASGTSFMSMAMPQACSLVAVQPKRGLLFLCRLGASVQIFFV